VSALQYKHPRVARALLDDGNFTGVNDRTANSGAFALFVAAGEGYADLVERILAVSGCDIDLTTHTGASSLAHALARHRCDVAALLLARGAKVDALALEAQDNCNLALMPRVRDLNVAGEALVRATTVDGAREALDAGGADVNHVAPSVGATALHRAAQHGDAALVEFLLKRGADVNARAAAKHFSATPLYLAAYEGHVAVVEALLSRPEIDVELGIAIPKGASVSPLVVAVEKNRAGVVNALLRSNGALKSLPRALDVAATYDLPAIAAKLVPKASASARASALIQCVGDSATMAALPELVVAGVAPQAISDALSRLLQRQRNAQTGRVPHALAKQAVETLLSGAPKPLVLTAVLPPLTAAVLTYLEDDDQGEADALELVRLLLPFTQGQPAAAKSKVTPLHVAVELKRMRIVDVLLDAPGGRESLVALSSQGETVLDVAKRNGVVLRRGADEL